MATLPTAKDFAPMEQVPACVSALSTMPARGTAKHRLSPQQLLDQASRQAAAAAQHEAAAQRKAVQDKQRHDAVQRQALGKQRAAKEAEAATLATVSQRAQAAETRKQQRAARERQADEERRKAATAAARSVHCYIFQLWEYNGAAYCRCPFCHATTA